MWGVLAGILAKKAFGGGGGGGQGMAGPLNAFDANVDKYQPPGMGQYQAQQQAPQQGSGPFSGGQNLAQVMQALAQRFGGQGGGRAF